MKIYYQHRAILISAIIFIVFFEIIFRKGITALEGAIVAAILVTTLFLSFIAIFSIWRLQIKNKIPLILLIYISALIIAPIFWAAIYGIAVYSYAVIISIYFPLNKYLHIHVWNIFLNIKDDWIMPSIFSGLLFYSSKYLLNKIDQPIRLRWILRGGGMSGDFSIYL